MFSALGVAHFPPVFPKKGSRPTIPRDHRAYEGPRRGWGGLLQRHLSASPVEKRAERKLTADADVSLARSLARWPAWTPAKNCPGCHSGGGIETKETGRSAEARSRFSALTQFLSDWETDLARLGWTKRIKIKGKEGKEKNKKNSLFLLEELKD